MGALNLRDVPKDSLYRVKLAAAVERRTVKSFPWPSRRGAFTGWRRRGCCRRGSDWHGLTGQPGVGAEGDFAERKVAAGSPD